MSSLAAIPVVTAAVRDNEKQVRICHATSSQSNPYVENHPAIENNGDLNGGHLDHTGPVYPDDGWGDIIPPYKYVDSEGKPQAFPGYNWGGAGQGIWERDCNVPAPPERQETARSRSSRISARRTILADSTSRSTDRRRRPGWGTAAPRARSRSLPARTK